MKGRLYDYKLGRFLSVDPIVQFPANSQSLNPYSYIMNNPLAGTDPTGFASCVVGKGQSCTAMNRDPRSANKLGNTRFVQKGDGAVYAQGSLGGAVKVTEEGGALTAMLGPGPGGNGAQTQSPTGAGGAKDQHASPDEKENNSNNQSGNDPATRGPEQREFLATAQARYNAALAEFNQVEESILAPQFGSEEEAHSWFRSFAQPITDKYGPELGANIISDHKGAYWIEDAVISPSFSPRTGLGAMVNIRIRKNDASWVAYTHTHPMSFRFSPADISVAAGRGINAYVSVPGGASYRFSFDSYVKKGGIGMEWSDIATDPRFVTPVRQLP